MIDFKKAFVDTASFIYFIEKDSNNPQYHEKVKDFFKYGYDNGREFVSSVIAMKSAQIRAEYKGIKAMDALQLAAACLSKCDLFLTNDKQLKQFKEIQCVTVEEL